MICSSPACCLSVIELTAIRLVCERRLRLLLPRSVFGAHLMIKLKLWYQRLTYSHSHLSEFFLRGLPKLTSLMVRMEGQGPKSTPNPEGEPDFYRISRQHPVPPVDQPKRAPSHSGSAKMTSTSAASLYEAMNWNPTQQATQQPTVATLQSSETALPAAAASMACGDFR